VSLLVRNLRGQSFSQFSAAYNGRQAFVKQLMSHIRIDSYGNCLNTIQAGPINKNHQSNLLLYASYKFVIAIENSNCEDYVTEKLIDALASASIPIVASRDGKPDYRRFAPKHSYINVYDYPSTKELAAYLNYLSNNETAYNEYLWFRQPPANKYAVRYHSRRRRVIPHCVDIILVSRSHRSIVNGKSPFGRGDSRS
jgi:hypothetical protein